MVYNKIQVAFGSMKRITGPAINYQYDVKQILVINGLNLPEYYVVDFCNEGDATVIPMTGTSDGVEIPDSLLQTGKPVKAYIVVSSGQGDIQTRYEVKLPVNTRPMRDDIHPTDPQQQQIDALVATLNDGVSRAETAASEAEESAGSASADADRAETAATRAEEAVEDVSAYAIRAETAAGHAESSAQDAAESAGIATDKAEEAAGHSESSAESAAASREYAESADHSADEAAGSAQAADTSASASATSARQAAASATNAQTSAGQAANSATAAGQSATNAAGSATTATTQAGIATSKAGEAAQSATAASGSATAAGNSQTAAEAAQAAAEEAAESVEESAAQIAQNTQDISDVKNAISANKEAVADTQSMIATVEATTTASKNYAVGDLLVYDGKLYKVTSAIATGATIIVGSNVALTTVETQLASASGGGSDWTSAEVTVSEEVTSALFDVPLTAKEVYLEYEILRTTTTSSYIWVGADFGDNNNAINRLQAPADSVYCNGACNITIGYNYISSYCINGTKTSVPPGYTSMSAGQFWASSGAKNAFTRTGKIGVGLSTGIAAGSKISLRYR